MSLIWRLLLIIAVTVILIIIGFNIHWLLGTAIIVAIIGYLLYSNRSILYAQRGNIAYMKGDEEKALAMLEKAYQTKGANPQQMIGYAYLLMKTGNLERSEKLLKELLGNPLSDPNRLLANVNLATTYWLQGNQDEGYHVLEELSGEYKNTQLYSNLGYFKILRGGDLEEALAYNQEAYEYNSDDLTILDNLAQNYYFLGRLDEANEIYAKVMDKSPKSADSYYYHALTLKGLGQIKEAKEQAELAKDKKLALVTTITKDDIQKLAEELSAL